MAGLVRSPKNISVYHRQPDRHVTVKVYVCANQTYLKSVFKMSSMCSIASYKTWTPLPDRFIDEHLVDVPTLDQVRLQRVNVTNPAAVHTLLQLTTNLVVYWVEVRTFS